MIAQAKTPARSPAPGSPSLAGNKVPVPHRFHLSDGRVIQGDLHRSPHSRLADHLATLKGFLCVTKGVCDRTGETFPFVVINQDHLLFVEELAPSLAPAPSAQGHSHVHR